MTYCGAKIECRSRQTVLSLYLDLDAIFRHRNQEFSGRDPMTDDMPEGVIQTDVKAELFKSMGHPARILILEMMVDGPVAVSRLRDGTGLEASNLSQHLGILRRQRLIVPSRKD